MKETGGIPWKEMHLRAEVLDSHPGLFLSHKPCLVYLHTQRQISSQLFHGTLEIISPIS